MNRPKPSDSKNFRKWLQASHPDIIPDSFEYLLAFDAFCAGTEAPAELKSNPAFQEFCKERRGNRKAKRAFGAIP